MMENAKYRIETSPSPLGGTYYNVVDAQTGEIESTHPGRKAAEWHIENRLGGGK